MKVNKDLIIKVQAMVRGYLYRRNMTNGGPEILYNKSLKWDGQFIRFVLIKRKERDYKLMAVLRKQSTTVEKTSIPFRDEDASDMFKKCLLFEYDYNNNVTQLDLVSPVEGYDFEEESVNPFVDVGTPPDEHLFITESDYSGNKNHIGDTLIKGFTIKDEMNVYPAQFFEVNESNGAHYYKVCVSHNTKTDYLKLHKLPQEMFHMAYYLSETVKVERNQNNIMKYINLKVPKDKYEFRNRMSALEKYYGFTRT